MIRSKRAQDKYRQDGGGVYSPSQVHELLTCSKDPKHFIRTHIAIQSPMHGMHLLTLRPEQENYIDAIHDHDSTVCKHPRQAGITTASLAYLLWQSQFQFDKIIAVILPSAQHADDAKRILRSMYSTIPEYLVADIQYENRNEIQFTNGSRILFRAATAHVGRGITISTLYLGDLAYVDQTSSHPMWASLMPCIGTGSKIIIHSTPSDPYTLFCDIWQAALVGIVPIHPHAISFWDLHDASQAKWDTLEAMLGTRIMRRSFGCEFVA
jgi:hypothetical protein